MSGGRLSFDLEKCFRRCHGQENKKSTQSFPVGSKYKCLLINFINQSCIYKYIHNLTILILNIGIYKIALGKTILYSTT